VAEAIPGPTAEAAQGPDPALTALLPLEIRVHGRGGQGGVTCAKLVATLYADLGLYVQSFGDYGMERSGAPVRAFTRVDAAPITNRNKVYAPGHLLVLDPTLMGDEVLEGAPAGGLLLLNTPAPLAALAGRSPHLRLATVDAGAIARRHGIGTSAVVIVNTALVGAYARVVGLPWGAVQRTYHSHQLDDDLEAAREAFEVVVERPASSAQAPLSRPAAHAAAVLPITEHVRDQPTPALTGSWRTQLPRYRTHPAPCHLACPAGNDLAGVLGALREGGVETAARLLLATQPLPSVCGRVCPAPCMKACNRAHYDGAVHIRGLERWIGDHAGPRVERPAAPARRLRVAVVGGGPAGISAAFALARAGHEALILEAEPALGGVLRTGIPTYRLPAAALDRDLGRLAALGVVARCRERIGPAELQALAAERDAVIVATGLPVPSRLEGADGPERLAGVSQGLEFLRQVRAGRALALRGHTVVVGGGNTAVDCARTALRCGAARVTLAYRRGRAEMPAIPEEVEEALAEGVELLLLRQPVRLVGAGRLEGVELAEVTLGERDATGRRRPVVGGGRVLLACDHLLLALGQGPDRTLAPGGAGGEVWLAGDLATGAGTVSQAVGHGRRVAEEVLARLEGRPAPGAGEAGDVVTPAHVRFAEFAPSRSHRERLLGAAERRTSWAEVNGGLRGPEEARRCFSCGTCTRCDTCLLACPEGIVRRVDHGYAIDERYCKGCGMCVAECPRRAMEISPDGRSSP